MEHGDLDAEANEEAGEFERDIAAADDGETLRDFRKGQRLGRGDHRPPEGQEGQLHRHGAGGDDDVLGLENLDFARVIGDFDLAGGEDLARALDPVDLVLLEQEGDAFDVRLHRRVLVRHHLRQVERRRADLHTEIGHTMGSMVEDFRGVQQSLGGNAADV